MKTALIIGDIQRGITGAYPFARQVVPPLTELLPRARAAGVLVVFVRIAFRANRADLPPGNAAGIQVKRGTQPFPPGIPACGN